MRAEANKMIVCLTKHHLLMVTQITVPTQEVRGISHHSRISWVRASSRIKILAKMKACPITRSVVTIQFMLVKFYSIDMLLFKNSDGVTSLLFGSLRILNSTTTLQWKCKRALSIIWKQHMTRLKSWIRSQITGKLKNGKIALRTFMKMIHNWRHT